MLAPNQMQCRQPARRVHRQALLSVPDALADSALKRSPLMDRLLGPQALAPAQAPSRHRPASCAARQV